MKPTTFDYHRPDTIEETLELLNTLEHAEVLAGNQSLGIIMANRLATPDHLVDINQVDDLAFVEVADDRVGVGAMTRHRTLERNDELRAVLEGLPEAAEEIAGPAVRNRGTVGGSMAEADPAGNYPTVMVALDGELTLESVAGERTVSARDFFIAYMFTDLGEDELITGVRMDTSEFPVDRTGSVFLEQKRGAQTFPTVSAAALVVVDDPGADDPVVETARLALGNVDDIPLLVQATAELEGGRLTDESLESVASAAIDAAAPSDEMHADSEYKRELAGEYARRSLKTAYERARQ